MGTHQLLHCTTRLLLEKCSRRRDTQRSSAMLLHRAGVILSSASLGTYCIQNLQMCYHPSGSGNWYEECEPMEPDYT
ncbi:hypothetical protein K474DRAFT_1384434 [Panus rudis PR-1116 ss-1]|nr:hypothetical protein K474DRAFT_1384434 [Panus rudis PR-1116 ss-1]